MAVRTLGVEMTADARQMVTGLGQASRAVGGFGQQVAQVAQLVTTRSAAMAVGFTVAAFGIAKALEATVAPALEFEAAMRNVNSILHSSEREFGRTSDAVLELSQTVPQSATDLARGFYDVASAGFDAAEGQQVLEAGAKAATAGLTDTATATRAIISVIRAYGLEASDAADVSDTLFQTVNLGILTFEELAQQLGDVVGIAAAAKVNIADVGSAIAAITLAGIPAPEAVTSLNRVIQSLLEPSDALSAALKHVGLEGKALTDLLATPGGLNSVMETLRVETGGNVQALLALFPEIRAARGAFALMSAEGKNYERTQRGIGSEAERAAATQRAFNEQMKAAANQLKLAMNQAKAWGIEMGTHILPLVRQVASALGVFIKAIAGTTRFLSEHREILEAVALVYATKLSFALFQRIGVAVYDLLGAVFRATGGWAAFGTTSEVVATQASIATTAVNGLKAALATLAPFAAALVASGLIDWFMDLKGAVSDAAQAMRDLSDIEVVGPESGKAIRAAEAEYKRLEQQLKDLERGTFTGGVIGGVIEALPFTENKTAKIRGQMDDIREAMDELEAKQKNFSDNALDIADDVGATWSPELAERIAKIAAQLDVDLTSPFADSQEARRAVVREMRDMADRVGLTTAEFEALGPAMIQALQEGEEAAKKASEAVADFFSLMSDFDLKPAKEAAEDYADAIDAVEDAEQRLRDAQERVNDNLRYITRTPERERELAEARRDVADAERDVAEARRNAADAQRMAQDPEAAITEQYRKQVENYTQFLEDVATAGDAGIDSGFLLRAMGDPEQFAPILRAIAEDTDGTLVDTINRSEARLIELRKKFEAQFGLVRLAVQENMGEVPDIIADALNQALTAPVDDVYKLAWAIGQKVKEGVTDGMGDVDLGGIPQRGSAYTSNEFGYYDGQGMFHPYDRTVSRARGGIDAHIATSPNVLYGERGTGGEAFIPLGANHRGRSTSLLNQVASMFGYGLVSMQRGGIFFNGGTSGPVHHTKNTTFSIGTVQAQDYSDFRKQLAREERMRAVTGGV